MHPAMLFIVGALLLPLFRKFNAQKIWLVVVPLLAIIQIKYLPESFGTVEWLGFNLQFGRVDKLSFVFLHVFTLMALIGSIFGLHVKESGQHIAAWLYVAGSLGTVLAGDYLTVFIFWELMAVASVFLVWYRRRRRSTEAGFRYLLVHTFGGLVLLAGILLRYQNVHDLSFDLIVPDTATFADYLIMIGFMLNAAVPPIHAWLPDAYPEATVTGAVFMCAFTTKTAVYALARGFVGFEALVILGAIMTLYGVGYAVIEDDARRILAYHIISQVGYMVCGVGIGTHMAVNGTCSHAYAHILYKALLFMGVGSVLEMTGRSKLSELGGLYKYMPISLIFTVIGGMAISGLPFTSGFISKSMIIAAAGNEHQIFIFLMLSLAAVGTFLHTTIKVPYFIWFGPLDPGLKPKECYWNMHVGMFMAAFMCIFLGVYPEFLYSMLPYAVDYQPYNAYHFSESMQMLGFTGLGFYLMNKYQRPHELTNFDLDWVYRKGAKWFMWLARKPFDAANEWVSNVYQTVGLRFTMATARAFSWFDWEGIDWALDGSAKGMIKAGGQTRQFQTGKLQHYIGAAAGLVFVISIVVVLV
jgi:multicomponent Na+:H+ antiporter subunit D